MLLTTPGTSEGAAFSAAATVSAVDTGKLAKDTVRSLGRRASRGALWCVLGPPAFLMLAVWQFVDPCDHTRDATLD